MDLPWQQRADGMGLPLHVTPKARVNIIVGLHNGRLSVKVTAVPEDGKANAAVIKLLSKALGIAASRLAIASGATSRDKLLLVRGAGPQDVPQSLGT
jgi:uncharacterized protein (TIGR00251 family)